MELIRVWRLIACLFMRWRCASTRFFRSQRWQQHLFNTIWNLNFLVLIQRTISWSAVLPAMKFYRQADCMVCFFLERMLSGKLYKILNFLWDNILCILILPLQRERGKRRSFHWYFHIRLGKSLLSIKAKCYSWFRIFWSLPHLNLFNALMVSHMWCFLLLMCTVWKGVHVLIKAKFNVNSHFRSLPNQNCIEIKECGHNLN